MLQCGKTETLTMQNDFPTLENTIGNKVRLGKIISALGFEHKERSHVAYYKVVPLRAAWARRERWWERYGRDMGGIQDISPMLFPFCTKGFPKIMGEMIDIRGFISFPRSTIATDFRLMRQVCRNIVLLSPQPMKKLRKKTWNVMIFALPLPSQTSCNGEWRLRLSKTRTSSTLRSPCTSLVSRK